MAEWIKICQIREINASEPHSYDRGDSKIMLTKLDNEILQRIEFVLMPMLIYQQDF